MNSHLIREGWPQRAWLQWGPRCLPRLNGMFAFAVWDAAREELSRPPGLTAGAQPGGTT